MPIEEAVLHDAEASAISFIPLARRPGVRPAALVPARPGGSSTVPYRTDGDLVALASRVVHGRVLSVRTEPGDSNRIYTVARVAVIEDLTGVDESIVEVRELGGRIGIDEMFVAGAPGYVAGQEVLLILERGPRGLRNVALSFSAFHVVPESVAGAEPGWSASRRVST